ncbi:MAG TPA: hypothetical protein VF131_01705 [Blastocatellia bacterium]|nr:hypothetical protein [Blastocatellia bacterium]
MRRVFACLFIMAVFPLVASPTWDNSNNPAPFATVALAGHVSGGGYCACGSIPGCICDPGEQPGDGLTIAPSNGSDDYRSVNQDSVPDVDLASGALMLALAFLFWFRIR